MPGNTIVINNKLSWYIGDSKMPELIRFLEENGVKEDGPESATVITTDLCQQCDKLRILSIEDRPQPVKSGTQKPCSVCGPRG